VLEQHDQAIAFTRVRSHIKGDLNAKCWKDRSVDQDFARAGDDRLRIQDRGHGLDLADLAADRSNPTRDGILLDVPALYLAGVEHGEDKAHFLSPISWSTMAGQIISVPRRRSIFSSALPAGLLAHK
jgi:hypothetical protein